MKKKHSAVCQTAFNIWQDSDHTDPNFEIQKYQVACMAAWCALDIRTRSTLGALCDSGPLKDGDLLSKNGRDFLLDHQMAVKVVFKGEDGYQALTYFGRDVYHARLLVNSPQENSKGREVS